MLRVPVDSDRAEFVGGTSYAGVYRLKDTLPRARFAPRVRLVPTMEEVTRLSVAGALDPRQEVVLHDAADMRRVASAQSGPGDAPGDARIVVDRVTEVVVEAQTTRGGLLVLADTYYPGWRVTVDGREQRILRANVMQRGVAVPPGSHRVAFEFRSQSVRRGWLLTAVGLALLLGASLVLALWKGRETQPVTRGAPAD
jgi:hypothetical protein